MSLNEMMAFGSSGTESNDSVASVDTERARASLSYDASFKKFFSRKEVLAGILLGVIPEFKGLTHQEVMDCILTSEVNGDYAELLNTEDIEESQKIVYDIVTKVFINRREQEVHLLFDLEMQYNYKTEYTLMNRAIYYVSRLIAKQNMEHAKYGSLLPVRSTWIAMRGVPRELQNQVIHFSLEPRGSNGELVDYQFKGLDMIGIDYILLSENYYWDEADDATVKFLQSIFQDNLNDRRFNPYITPTEDVEREVFNMSTRLDHINADLRYSREEGRIEGREEGRIEGREEGRKEGRIEGLILGNLADGVDEDMIIKKLVTRLHLTEEEALYYLNKFKNSEEE